MTTSMQLTRRSLHFNCLDEIIAEVKTLEAADIAGTLRHSESYRFVSPVRLRAL